MIKKEEIDIAKEHLIDGNIDLSIDLIAKKNDISEHDKTFFIFKQQFRALKTKLSNNLISQNDYKIELSRLTNNYLDLLKEYENEINSDIINKKILQIAQSDTFDKECLKYIENREFSIVFKILIKWFKIKELEGDLSYKNEVILLSSRFHSLKKDIWHELIDTNIAKIR